uniref:ATP-binding protein n=1 Tax=Prevotella sp. TaxID=59823 RepID=UPI004028BBB5
MEKLIERPYYINMIRPFIGKNVIKVLTGQRRVGKSCILKQLANKIVQTNADAHIIFINKELEDFAFIHTHEDLSKYVGEQLKAGADNYLFIDEIQDIENFEVTLRSLQASDACDIYITGSNAKMFSSELATHLSGRYVEFHIHSLSYEEFLTFHHLEPSNKSLRDYLLYGGMPYLTNLPLERDVVFEYLQNVYNTILLKDVVKREGIRNVEFLETLALYTADNVGNLFSANNISKYLKSQHVKTSPVQIINYLRAMQNAFLIQKVRRVDINGLRMFEIGDKYYFEDLGLRNCRLSTSVRQDINKLIENAIYLYLCQQRFKVFTGQMPDGKEIDFVGLHDDSRIYVQASYLMMDEATRNREFGNLKAINDNYPKYVVSLDEWTSGSNVEGIQHVHLGEFLQMKLT